ncbi:hypothetical protein [Micromonospora costi]|nr:hypothetical protein [Micromonospora costi]
MWPSTRSTHCSLGAPICRLLNVFVAGTSATTGFAFFADGPPA